MCVVMSVSCVQSPSAHVQGLTSPGLYLFALLPKVIRSDNISGSLHSSLTSVSLRIERLKRIGVVKCYITIFQYWLVWRLVWFAWWTRIKCMQAVLSLDICIISVSHFPEDNCVNLLNYYLAISSSLLARGLCLMARQISFFFLGKMIYFIFLNDFLPE